LANAKFYELLLKFDEDLSAEAQAAGCPRCRGRLDRANYPRKPRGAMAKLVEEYSTRFSFCCAQEDCRRRHTPPSLRFLGRRVYLGAIVVLACAMQQGATPVRARRLRELLGVSERTLSRWRQWWQSVLGESDFWKAAQAFFVPPAQPSGFPLSLLERFGGDEESRLIALLRLLKPVTTPAGYVPDQAR
jgi:hypothetical protein